MEFHSTTIVAVKRDGKVAIAGDGQVTFGNSTVMKSTAKKVRRLYHDKIIAGFAGSVADAFTLFEKFEEKLESTHGHLMRAAVALAKDWRTDKILSQKVFKSSSARVANFSLRNFLRVRSSNGGNNPKVTFIGWKNFSSAAVM